ncbi:MAG: D-alanyl-D-alanine carboxypeptidase/D-alanyl-D-alanine-endopeptidase [Bryobacteraceae bacterium]|nr:D-alanyl-D-alanine carboxypeptidase/D-alanyl-D-alanine-endopeptidase [Bryobacteraceae bacterium]
MRSTSFRSRIALSVLCLAPALFAPALLAEDPLAARLQALVAAPPLDRAMAGVRVVEIATGRVVFDYHGNTGFMPASNTKLFSGAFAMAKLGAAYRFQSSVRAASQPDGAGIVRGDLTLLGGGDPTLSGRAYPFETCQHPGDGGAALRALAVQLASRGVKRIEGDIVGDDTRYPYEPYGPEWTVEDTGAGGEAPVSAWMIDDNVTGSGDDERGVPDPALAVAGRFRQALFDQGIEVRGQARARHRQPNDHVLEPVGGVELASRASVPLSQILQTMEKCSVNLHAESLLLEAAFQVRGELMSRASALDEERLFLVGKGVPAGQFELHDGSGLSRANLVTPTAVTSLLLAIQAAPWRDSFLAAMSIGGVDGTLEHRFGEDPLARQIRAKTGTLRHVAALSGFAANRYAFSILVNHFFPADAEAVVKAIDTIALEIVKATE